MQHGESPNKADACKKIKGQWSYRMSKKSNSLLFMLVATVVNIVLTLICMIILLVVYIKLIAPSLPQESASYGIPIIFVAAIVMSFFIYRAGVKIFAKKVDIEKNFDPLFGRRKPQQKKDSD
jgi:uncharacterized membrane protein (DUF485 family)